MPTEETIPAYLAPLINKISVGFPGNLKTNRIILHFIKEEISMTKRKQKITEHQFHQQIEDILIVVRLKIQQKHIKNLMQKNTSIISVIFVTALTSQFCHSMIGSMN